MAKSVSLWRLKQSPNHTPLALPALALARTASGNLG
jgi:hypothetical protein